MERRLHQDGADDDSDVHLNLQQHQQALHKLQEHLRQEADGQVQQSQQQQQRLQDALHVHPQQQLQPTQQPVFPRGQHQQQDRLLVEKQYEQTGLGQVHGPALPPRSPPGEDTEWKQCAKCGLQFPVNMLQIHVEDCLTSGDGTSDSNDLRVCSTALFVCSVCAKITHSLSGLREHEQSHAANGDLPVTAETTGQPPAAVFMCSPCGLTFASSDDLVNHVEVHKNNSSAEKRACCICGKVFQQQVGLLQHLDAHHGHVKACPCGAIFPAKQDFRNHQEHCMPVLRDPTAATSQGPRSYRCRLCPKVFGTVQSRLQHERVHRRDGSDSQPACVKPLNKTKLALVCTLCKQEFNAKENYRAHVRSHTGEKPYSCRHCLKSFSSLQGRWQHEKIHKR